MRRFFSRQASQRDTRARAKLGGKAKRTFSPCVSGPYLRHLRIEPLEDRSLLSAVSWDGGGDGSSWSDKLNWSGNVLPGASDDVTIDAPGGVTVTLSSAFTTIHSLTVGSDDTLTIINPGNLTVNAASSIAGSLRVSTSSVAFNGATSVESLFLSSGAISGTGDLTVTNKFNWQSGTVSGSGRTIVAPGATLSISNGVATLNRTLENDGDVISAYSLGLNGVTFQNNGTYTSMASAGSEVSIGGVSGTNVFNNAGTFIQAGGQTQIGSDVGATMLFNNTGTLEVQSSTLDIVSGGTNTGSIAIATGAELRIVGSTFSFAAGGTVTGLGAVEASGGALSIDAPTSLPNFILSGTTSLSGTLTGSADLTVTNSLSWTGGAMTGSGRTIIPPTAALSLNNLSNMAPLTLSRLLENDGSIVWSSGDLHMSGGLIQNNGAMMAASFAVPQLNIVPDSGLNVVNNVGTFTNLGTAGVNVRSGTSSTVAFNSFGTVNGQIGAIQLKGGGTQADQSIFAGTVSLSRDVGAMAPTFIMGSEIYVTGNLTISTPIRYDAATTFAGAGTVTLAGDVSGVGDLTFDSNVNWTTGAMTGSGKTVIASGSTLRLITSSNPGLSRVLENDGTTQWVAGSVLRMNGGTFQNNGTTVVIASSGNFAVAATSTGGVNAFNNAGTFTNQLGQFSPTQSSVQFGVPVNNSGTLTGTSDSIQLNAGGTNTPGAAFAGTILLSGGTFVFAENTIVTGSLNITTPVSFDAPASFAGAGVVNLSAALSGAAEVQFDTTLAWTAGAMSGSGRTMIGTDGTLTLSGSAAHTLNRVLENDGVVIWTAGDLALGASLYNNGSFRANTSATLNSYGSGANGAFENAGQFVQEGGSTMFIVTAGFGSLFDNSGVVSVIAGLLELDAGGTSTGAFDVAGSATLAFNGGVYEIAASETFNGGGTVLVNGGVLNVDEDVDIVALSLSAGAIGGAADLTVTSTFNWSGGTMSGVGTTTIAPGATLNFLGGGTLSRTLWNDGLTDLSYGSLSMIGGTFQNLGKLLSGTISTPVSVISTGGVNNFNNLGTTVNGGSSTLNFGPGVLFNNTGTVDGGGAGILLSGGGVEAPGAIFAGIVSLTGGTNVFGSSAIVTGNFQIATPTNFDTPVTFSGPGVVALSSTLSGSANVTFDNMLEWSGGIMTGTGSTIIAPGATLVLKGASSMPNNLNRLLENDGIALWLSGDMIMNNGTFQNNGSVQAFNGGSSYGFGGVNAFNNAGTFTNLGNHAVSFFIPEGQFPVAFNNEGAVDGKIGGIQLTSGGTHGSEAIFSGAIILGGVQAFSNTATINGTLSIASPTTIDAPVVFSGPGSVNLSSTLSGAGYVTFATTLNWIAGEMSGSGKTIIAPTGSLNIAPNLTTEAFPELKRMLENDGLATWSGGYWQFTAGTFNNNGTMEIVGSIAANTLGSGANAFNNAGLLVNLGNGFTTFNSAVPFNNSGTIEGNGLEFDGGGAYGPSAVFAGSINLGGGPQVFDTSAVVSGTLTISTPVSFDAPVTFSGPGAVVLANPLSGSADVTFNTTLTWSSGLMSGSGTTIIGPQGTLNLTSAGYDLERTLENDGSAFWTKGDLRMTGGAFQNNGSFVASSNTTLNSYGGGGANVFNNAGLFSNAGAGLVKFYANAGSAVIFNNSGTADGGIRGLEINAGGNHADGATFNGAVNITGGSFSFGATTTLLGTLKIAIPWNVTSDYVFNGSGVLLLSAATTIAAGGDIAGNATINLASTLSAASPIVLLQPVVVSATGTINSPATLSTLTVSGTLAGSGDITVVGLLSWTGGTISGTGVLDVGSGAAMSISGASHGLNRSLRTDGTTTWTGSYIASSAVWQNYGVFTANLNYVLNPLDTSPGQFGAAGASFVNFGSLILIGPSILGTLGAFDNEGLIDVENGTLQVDGTLFGPGLIEGSQAGTLQMLTDLVSGSTDPAQFNGLGNLQFQTSHFSGPAVPLLFEAQSKDMGNVAAGFIDNSAIQTLALAPLRFGLTYVQLVDQFDNAPGAGPEAVYVNTLIVPGNATLDLNGLHLYARNIQVTGTILNGQVTQLLPEVTQVLVAGSNWSPAFLDQMQAAGLGTGGYAIPGNAIDQLAPLPWSGLDEIKIAFNEDVNVQAGSLTVTSATSGAITPVAYAYDAVSHIATWTLAQPIGNDNLTLSLAASGPAAVTDVHGAALDGEWPSAAAEYPSGNGVAGGDFAFQFNVLPGDVTQDGIVDIQDLTNIANHWLQPSPLSDPAASGKVDIVDLTLIANNWQARNNGAGGGGGAGLTEAAVATPAAANSIASNTSEPSISLLQAASPSVPIETTQPQVAKSLAAGVASLNALAAPLATAADEPLAPPPAAIAAVASISSAQPPATAPPDLLAGFGSSAVTQAANPLAVNPLAVDRLSALRQSSDHATENDQATDTQAIDPQPIDWRAASYVLSHTPAASTVLVRPLLGAGQENQAASRTWQRYGLDADLPQLSPTDLRRRYVRNG